MTTSFSTDTYFKDINTLEDLDTSGMRIGTSSGSLKNIFGSEIQGNPVVQSLADKFDLINTTAIDRTAYNRDICCIERLTDISIIIKVNEQKNHKN